MNSVIALTVKVVEDTVCGFEHVAVQPEQSQAGPPGNELLAQLGEAVPEVALMKGNLFVQ